jgi:hypothetical protein
LHRKLLVAGVVAVASLGIAAPAFAQTMVPLTFNHLVLDTPVTGNAQIVSPTTQPLTVDADVDLTTGAFTVQPSGLTVPSYSFTSPVNGSITLALNGPATGTVDFATGALTLNADFTADITLTGAGNCVKDTGPLSLSTAATKPIPGQAFPAGATGATTGDGAFGASWTTLAPGTGSACAVVDSAVDGPGGIWVSRGINPPGTAAAAPKLAISSSKVSSVKSGGSATVTVVVANSGGADSKAVKVCVASPKPLSPKSSCKTISSFGASAKKTETFKVKTKKGKTGSYKLALSVSGSGVTTVNKKLTLKVK